MPNQDKLPVWDLHCDLVTYLHMGEGRTPYEVGPRCSIPQLREGGVALQVLALFSMTGTGSSKVGLEQARIFDDLLARYGDEVAGWSGRGDEKITLVAALESASAIAEEDEPLDDAFARFDELAGIAGPLLYASPTWVQENRFAGGNGAPDVGLKDDGRILIEFLTERGVALDVSHLSPRSAHDAMDFLAKKGLEPPVMASHSDFAGKLDITRNLPDDVAREVFRRGGVVGLNFMRPYTGDSATDLAAHLSHGLELGGRDHLCLGADYFCVDDIPVDVLEGRDPSQFFHDDFCDASCYPRFFEMLVAEGLDEGWLPALAHGNARRFLEWVLGH